LRCRGQMTGGGKQVQGCRGWKFALPGSKEGLPGLADALPEPENGLPEGRESLPDLKDGLPERVSACRVRPVFAACFGAASRG